MAIAQEFVEVSLNSNQVFDAIKYWTEKGYTNLRPQQKLLVRVDELPPFSAASIMFRCDDCGVEWKRRYSKRFCGGKIYTEDLCHKCSRKRIGRKVGRANAIKAGLKNRGANHHNFNPNKKDFAAYAYKVRRISEENYKAHKDVINPDDLTRTVCGVEGGYQLDHKISVKWAFEHGLNPKIVGSVDNLQMLPWDHNRSKWYK